MSLELFDAAQHKVVPLLTGRKSEFFGRNEYETFDASDKHEEFWHSHKISPLLKVQSIVKNALDGLRCNAQFAKKLDDNMLNHDKHIPSIIRGRSIKESVMAFSSIDTFTPWKFEGIEDDAIIKICRELIDIVEIAHEKRERADDILEAGLGSRKRKMKVGAADTGCAAMQQGCDVAAAAGGDEESTSLDMLQNTAAKRMCTPPPNFQQESVSSQGSSAELQISTLARTPKIVAMYVEGGPLRIQEFLKGFIAELHGDSSVQASQQKWRLCKLVLLAYVRDNISDMCSGENSEGLEELLQWWQCICEEKRGLLFFYELDCMLKDKEPSALEGWNFDVQKAGKQYEACVFVLYRQVHEGMLKSNFLKKQWKQTVQAEWFEPLNTELAETLLDRADKFLRERSFVTTILGKLFETGSYIVFFRMDVLTARLVHEQCQIQHMLQTQRRSQTLQTAAVGEEKLSSMGVVDSAPPAAEIHIISKSAINFIVSSDKWHTWLSEGKSPSQVQVSEIVSDLQEIARLPPSLLEANEVPLSAAGSVKVEECIGAMQKKYEPGNEGSDAELDAETAADLASRTRERREKVNQILLAHVDARDFYLERLCGKGTLSVGVYVDSASGDERQVSSESIALVFVPNKSFNDHSEEDKDLLCPIRKCIMQEPVTCADGKTYERSAIERWAEINPSGPLTRMPLQVGGKLQYTPNVDIQERVAKFKKEKLAEFELLRQTFEGEDERRILCNRYGVELKDIDSEENTSRQQIDSAKAFFDRMVTRGAQSDPLACLTGPPASGKTITMQQIVYVAAEECIAQIKKGINVKTTEMLPLLPLFMRAAVLSKLISTCTRGSDEEVITLRQLVVLFLDYGIAQMIFENGAKTLILALFDVDQVLICIDGLDEAGKHQELVEGNIEHAVKEAMQQNRKLHVLLSTREHSYVHSRSCLRLGDFSVVYLQPLDDSRRQKLIQERLKHLPTEKVAMFQEQLKKIARKNPELMTSPFLLSLIIEIYKKDDAIPDQRVRLYSMQVEATVSRCITHRFDDNPEVRAAAQKLATKYLEILAFVCQLQMEERDFTLATCQGHIRELW